MTTTTATTARWSASNAFIWRKAATLTNDQGERATVNSSSTGYEITCRGADGATLAHYERLTAWDAANVLNTWHLTAS